MKSKFMAITVVLALVLSLVLALAGPVAASPPSWNVTGTWHINLVLGSDTYAETLVLTQSGGIITGNYVDLTTSPNLSSLFNINSGTVSGSNVEFTAHENVGGITDQWSGTIGNNGSSMSGTWQDTAGGTRSGTWQTTSGQAIAVPPPGQVTVNGNGNVLSSISLTLTAPTTGISFGDFHMGLNDWQQTATDGTVAFSPGIDTTASWSLWVYSGDYAGQDYSLGAMYSANCVSGPRYLSNPMVIAFSGSPPGAALPGGISMLTQTATSTTFGLSGQQTISLADAQAGKGDYSIVIQLYAQVNY